MASVSLLRFGHQNTRVKSLGIKDGRACGMQVELDDPVKSKLAAADLAVLVTRMQSGDQLALEALYDAAVNSVYRFAYSFVNSEADAEEITADVFYRAWRDAPSFDPTRGSVMTWLFMLCRSRALDRLRATHRTDRTERALNAEADIDVQPETDLVWAADGTRLHKAMSDLSAEQAQVMQLAYFGGYSHSEIAARLNMKLGTVKTHIRRTVELLRKQLNS